MQCTQCLMGKPLGAVLRCNSILQARSFTRVQACARCAVEGEAYCAECTCGYTFFRFITVLVVHPRWSVLVCGNRHLCFLPALSMWLPPLTGSRQMQTMS